MATGLLYLRSKMPRPKPIQISIPNPCTEDWNKMTPAEQGRFCSSCQKCVMDFTTFSDKQLYQYLTQHKNEHICGRYYSTQLNKDIQSPVQSQISLHKYFIALGLTIVLSEIPAQQLFAKAPYVYQTPHYVPPEDSTNNTHLLIGTVWDTTKEPIIGAFVEVFQNGITRTSTVTDEEGRYGITLPSGTYTVLIKYQNFINDTSTVVLNNDTSITTILKIDFNELEGKMVVLGMVNLRSTGDKNGYVIIHGIRKEEYEKANPLKRTWWRIKSRFHYLFH